MKDFTLFKSLLSTIILLSKFGLAANQEEEKYLELLNASPLAKSAKIETSNGFTWVEYCPDNTCEVIRTKAESSHNKLAILVTGYFLYVSKYSYLKQWQGDSTNRARFYSYLQSFPTSPCKMLEQDRLVECLLKNLMLELSAELLFIRFDERRVVSRKMDLKKEIETQFRIELPKNEK